ncbi:MAG: damage-control phosphatase ARMT1 family protein [Chloroflexota bacterium]|nr:damage-control phosphatase ARMT1 family protein [Chloroflexota bacterium]
MTSLPPFLMTSEPGTFARHTIEDRKPIIIDQVMADFDYTPSILKDLVAFKDELAHDHIKPLHEETSDKDIWDKALHPYLNKTWLELPWYLAESFFYRRVLEIVKYFQPGPWNYKDPYMLLKEKELSDALPILSANYPLKQAQTILEHFQCACYQALWGNRGDLSNLNTFETDMGTQTERIILDQAEAAFHLLEKKPSKVAYFMDNVGRELFFDLALIDFLLNAGLAKTVTCYVKNQPFFVSDAMPKDVQKSLDLLFSSSDNEISQLGNRLRASLRSRLLILEAPPFFTTSLMYREMPNVLRAKIATYDLTILKGDVNYRRLFGDRHWPPTTKVGEAAGYFPSSFLSLRTLKGELILGLSNEIIERIDQEADPDWLINGKRGMITFLDKSS